MLMGVAVLIALAGIVFAIVRLKPERLPRKRDAVEEEGFERVVANKYYVDEALDKAIVTPTYAISRNFLWRIVDNGLIDGLLVNGSAALARAFGWAGSRLQTGNVGIYAWVLVVGVVALLGAFTLR
jgi:NADH-quinone oxidoreductase subunit L